MNKATRIWILSAVLILLSLSVIALSTFALYSDSTKMHNHLQAGYLSATLVRTAHTATLPDGKGVMRTTEVTGESVNFSTATTENAFGLRDTDRFVPQSEVSATFRIDNTGTVAFGYRITILLTDAQGKKVTTQNAFARQLVVTVREADGTLHTMERDGLSLSVGSDEACIGIVGTGDHASFTVSVRFVDDTDDPDVSNNDAQGENVYFDLIVHLIQALSDE